MAFVEEQSLFGKSFNQNNRIEDLEVPSNKLTSNLNLKESQDLDLNAFTQLEKKQFLFCGLYPLRTNSKYAQLKHYVKFIFLVIFSTILFLSMTIALVIGVDNLSEVTAILYYLITQSAYLIKLVNFMIHRWKLPLLEEHLKHKISYKYYKIYGPENLKSIIRICYLTGLTFRISVTFVLVFYILVPLLASDTLLPFDGWMPVDKGQYRGLIFPLQIFCFIVSAYTNSSIDIYTAYYISIGVGHLRLLKTCLRNVDYTKTIVEDICPGKCTKAREEGPEEGNEIVEKQNGEHIENEEPKLPADTLEELLLLHEHLLTFVVMIESTFSYGIFVQFLASVAVICLTGFQMLVVSLISAEFVLLAFYFTCMMCQVVLYCWYGNEILFESGGIGEACYMSNWYEGTQIQKKVLILIMERSKREIFLTAGKFFILSLTTLVQIIKSSYSYFAVLQHIYKEN